MTEIRFSPAQNAAIEAQGHDLLVTASAGTGKTTVLVERILYKLRTGLIPSLEDLLIVTFTEKAAQEMRARISSRLSGSPELRRHLPQLPRASISTIHAFCARLLREHFVEAGLEPAFRILDENGEREAMDESLRATFHTWYGQKESEPGKEFRALVEMTGFDENGEVLRQIVRKLHDFSRVTPDPDQYLTRLIGREPAAGLEDLPWYPEMARQLEEAWRRGLRLYRAAIDLGRDHGKRMGAHECLLDRLETFTPETMADNRGREFFVTGLRDENAGGCDDEQPEARFYPRFCIKLPSAPKGANEIPGFADLLAGARRAFAHPVVQALPWRAERFLSEDRDQMKGLRVLVELVREADKKYKDYKARSGFLDFADLEIETVRLLEKHGADLGLTGRFREVLVDEFQDINALQDRILSSLSAEPGRFRVGDVKQSIYQFRLADPSIFLRLARARRVVRAPEEVRPGGGDPLVVFLAENHRSSPAICALVNHVFGRLMDEKTIGSAYSEQALRTGEQSDAQEPHASGESGRSAAEEDGADLDDPYVPELHLIEKPQRTDRAHAELDREARLVALRIDRLVRREGLILRDRDGSQRPASWRDVAILLRSQTSSDAFLRELHDLQIPAFLAHGGSLLEEESVRDLRVLLSTVDNPRDDVALAAVLRSPIFRLNDSELLRLRLAWPDALTLLDAAVAAAYEGDSRAEAGYFRPPDPNPGAAHGRSGGESAAGAETLWAGRKSPEADTLVTPRLRARMREILDRIRTWRSEAAETELVLFLERLLDVTDFRSILLGRGHTVRQSAVLEKFLGLARAYEAERGPSLHGFLARIAALEATGNLDAVPQSTEGDDAVSILSVHKAKGLEYPIVVLPRLGWRFRVDPLGGKIRIGERWVGLRKFDFEVWGRRDSSARWILQESQEEMRREEEKRILYVALTRAREKLILVGTSSKTPWAEPDPPDVLRAERTRRADSALGWILHTLPGDSGTSASVRLSSPPLRIQRYAADEITFAEPHPDSDRRPQIEDAIGRQGPLFTDVSAPDRSLFSLIDRVSRPSPFPPLAALDDLRGKYWVTEFKRLAEALEIEASREEGSGVRPALSGDDAAHLGTLYHAALARMDLRATDPAGLQEQLLRFTQAPWWGSRSRDEQIEAGIASFFRGPLGRSLAAASGEVEREIPFSLKWSLRSLTRYLPSLRDAMAKDPRWATDPLWSAAAEQTWVLLQGRIDCVFPQDGRWNLIDWKTDAVAAEQVPDRAAAYLSQMEIYREAVARMWGTPVVSWLVFLRPGTAVEVGDNGVGERGGGESGIGENGTG